MKIDTIPTKIKAPAMKHSIFTGKKYCFVHVDMLKDYSWDGEKQIIDFKRKALSVLWSEKELKQFRPNDTVHNFLSSLKVGQAEEIKRLKKARQKRYYKSKLYPFETIDLGKIRKERIDFLTDNDIRFIEIEFVY